MVHGGRRQPAVARLAAVVAGGGLGGADRLWLCAQVGCAHEEEDEERKNK